MDKDVDRGKDMFLSVIVVSLNAGEDLLKTVESILQQDAEDFEIIIKDGESSDGSVERLPTREKVKVYVSKDTSVYDGMNQAVEYATGNYILFMNCGDVFYDQSVIKRLKEYIQMNSDDSDRTIYYGDCYVVNRQTILNYPTEFNDYVCFTKTLCHQATIYPRSIFSERKYQMKYKICADFEYYVSAYCKGYTMRHLPVVIVNYLGGGLSETVQNRKRAVSEKKEILKKNFSRTKYLQMWLKMQVRGIGIKQSLSQSKYLYKYYSRLAGFVYRAKRKGR